MSLPALFAFVATTAHGSVRLRHPPLNRAKTAVVNSAHGRRRAPRPGETGRDDHELAVDDGQVDGDGHLTRWPSNFCADGPEAAIGARARALRRQ